ncbi:MAG: AAA family ATPase [Rhodoferax sp.]|nr:AAA family ATPase [Rhodoferax sp.]
MNETTEDNEVQTPLKDDNNLHKINIFKESLEEMMAAAQTGNSDAQFRLATAFENGQGVTRDLRKALKWYKKAAQQGHTAARLALGGDTEISFESNSQTIATRRTNKTTKIFGPPGTGKTRRLIDIVKVRIAEGVDPSQIAFVSFTNAAADEAKDRVAVEFPDMGSISFPNFSTLHSLATRSNGALGRTLCQKEHLNEFDKAIVCENEWIRQGDASSVVVRFKHPIMDQYCLALARCKAYVPVAEEKAIDAVVDFFQVSLTEAKAKFPTYAYAYIDAYEQFKISNHLADFNDVIVNTAKSGYEERLPSFDLLIVDEAQDLSDLQWSMVKVLIAKAREVYVAGDDDQAIMVGFGASANAFLELDGIEEELPQSYRVPKEVSDYVNSGVMEFLVRMPNRRHKTWKPALHSGEIRSLSDRTSVDKKTGKVETYDLDVRDLLRIVSLQKHEEWLIMAPTRATGKSISVGLIQLDVPHFYRNIPMAGAGRDTRINIRSIHTSKGLGADNVAIVVSTFGDVAMLVNDPRLAYVALTRAKKLLLPRVVCLGLLPKMMQARKGPWAEFAQTYIQMFPT